MKVCERRGRAIAVIVLIAWLVFGIGVKQELEDRGMDKPTSSVNRAYWVTVLKAFRREARTLSSNCLLEALDA